MFRNRNNGNVKSRLWQLFWLFIYFIMLCCCGKTYHFVGHWEFLCAFEMLVMTL